MSKRANNHWAKRRYQERKKMGLCIKCQKDSGGKYFCRECRHQANANENIVHRLKTTAKEKIDFNRISKRTKGCCAYCGKRKKIMTLDHVIPICKGGEHSHSNLILACKNCNSSKRERLLEDWAPHLVKKIRKLLRSN